MNELPADIAAAIEAFDSAAQIWGWEADQGTVGVEKASREYDRARAALVAALLARLAGAAEDDAEATCLHVRIRELEAQNAKLITDLRNAVWADSEHCKLVEAENKRLQHLLDIASDKRRTNERVLEDAVQDLEAENARLREALQQARLLIWDQLNAPEHIATIDAALAHSDDA